MAGRISIVGIEIEAFFFCCLGGRGGHSWEALACRRGFWVGHLAESREVHRRDWLASSRLPRWLTSTHGQVNT